MILAWLDITINLILIAHVVVSLLLALVILMQRPKQEGLGAAFGAGMTDAAWGARTTDVLQKGTVYLGTLFFVFSLILSILISKRNAAEGRLAGADEPVEEKIEQVEDTAADESVTTTDEAADFDKALKKAEEADQATESAETPETSVEAEEGAPVEEEPQPADGQ